MAVLHLQRAVANRHALVRDNDSRIRCELGRYFGEMCELKRKAKQLKLALQIAPGYLQGRYLAAVNLADQNQKDEPIEIFQLIADTPDAEGDEDGWLSEEQIVMMKQTHVNSSLRC